MPIGTISCVVLGPSVDGSSAENELEVAAGSSTPEDVSSMSAPMSPTSAVAPASSGVSDGMVLEVVTCTGVGTSKLSGAVLSGVTDGRSRLETSVTPGMVSVAGSILSEAVSVATISVDVG